MEVGVSERATLGGRRHPGSDGLSKVRHLVRMGQPRPDAVVGIHGPDLRLVGETAHRGGEEKPVVILLVDGARLVLPYIDRRFVICRPSLFRPRMPEAGGRPE